MNRYVTVSAAGAIGAVGYALGCWLARATELAERLEEQADGPLPPVRVPAPRAVPRTPTGASQS
jgi:predicted acylesterase/phospholipase RssA